MAGRYEDLSGEALELVLYMENEPAWHRGIEWCNGTLARHYVKGTFNRDMAPRAYAHNVKQAADQYRLEHGTMSGDHIFAKHHRDEVCELLAETFVSIVRQPEVWNDLGNRAAGILRKRA